jgi:uncharacterized protein (TIGR00369 family)
MQRIDQFLIDLKHGFAAGQNDKDFAVAIARARRPARARQRIRRREAATADPIGSNEIGIAKLANGLCPIRFATGPEIAPGEAAEHGRPAGVRTFALERVENFLDRIHAPIRTLRRGQVKLRRNARGMTERRDGRGDGLIDLETMASMSGMEVLQKILRGELPTLPIAKTLGFSVTEVEEGRTVVISKPGIEHYNVIRTVHAGYTATLLDTCMACAVFSTLAKGTGFTTMEFKISLLRPITKDTGIVRAEGTILSRGRRGATAEGRLKDANGKLLAHATTTCLIFPLETAPS